MALDAKSDAQLDSQPNPTREPSPGWVRRLVKYCWRYPVISTVAAVTSAALALNSLTPLLTKAVIDNIATGDRQATHWPLIGLVAVALGLFASTFLRRWSAGRLSLNVQHDLRQDVFGAIQRLDGAGQDQLRTGQVVSRANSDLQMIQGLMSMVPMAAGQVVMIAVSLVLMVTLSPLLTISALLVAPAAAFLFRQLTSHVFPATWVAQHSAAEIADIVAEDVTGVRVVKGFGQEDREIGRMRQAAGRLYAYRLRSARITARTNLLASVVSLGQVVVLVLGGALTISGSIGLGTFVAFTLYLAALVWPTRALVMLLVISQQAGAAVQRVLQVVDLDAGIADPPQPVPLPDGPLPVALHGVRFGYSADPTQSVLSGFELTVAAGHTVALVGPSGSGKSTVSLLLPRFYDAAAGSVQVGGVDVRAAAMADLRSRVGVVFEEAFLFSASIADNISYGRPDASRADIERAARAAEADEFIQGLPQGYDTVIGERGLTLSGGQRQRLALARAMMTDPQVLVLDDATSAVDPATEAAIHGTLKKLTADRTTILIAHRRSTLALADTIAVVDSGRVIDHGTHDQLHQRCALYRSLLGSDLAATPDSQALTAGLAGVTPALWPAVKPVATHNLSRSGSPGATPAATPGGMGGRGGGFAGAMGDVPLTEQLQAKIAALPEASDQPPDDTNDTDNSGAAAEKELAAHRISFFSILRPVRGLLLRAAVLVGFSALTAAALPALLRAGVDHGVSKASMTAVWVIAAAAAVLVAADYLVQRTQAVTMATAGESVLYRLRLKEFTHLQRLGLDYFEREMAGRIMTRMTTDVDALSTFLQTGLVTAVVSISTLVAITIALLVMNPALALVALSALPILIAATVVFRKYTAKQYELAREQVSKVNADLQENVAGLRVSQAMGRQEDNSREFARKSSDYRRIRMRAQTAISLYFPFGALLADVATVAVLAVGSQRVTDGMLTAGTLMAFVLYLGNFFTPINQLSQVFDGYQQAAVGFRRIADLLSTPTSTPSAVNPVAVERLSGEVTFDRVGFSYHPTTPPALRDVDLQIAPGQTVAIVGATGAGKSTLVKLIARFYDVTTGRVLLGGTDVREFDSSFRRRIAIVPQEAHLFVGSVRDNIAYGRPDASDAEVEAAARRVGALETIAGLRDGFFTFVDERGRNLSAGQRQLISLARAELVEPDLLLLDEATAALDPAAELAVLAATDAIARRRTTVVVAHRLATAARADRIVVMARGAVAEIGCHDELLARPGVYARLYAETVGH